MRSGCSPISATKPSRLPAARVWFRSWLCGSPGSTISSISAWSSELRGVRLDGRHLVIGAMTTQSEVLRSSLVAEHAPLLALASAEVGHFQIRNRATIGGSLAHADRRSRVSGRRACARTPRSTSQVRTVGGRIAAADFFLGPFTTALEPDEVVTALRVPVGEPRSGWSLRRDRPPRAATSRSPARSPASPWTAPTVSRRRRWPSSACPEHRQRHLRRNSCSSVDRRMRSTWRQWPSWPPTQSTRSMTCTHLPATGETCALCSLGCDPPSDRGGPPWRSLNDLCSSPSTASGGARSRRGPQHAGRLPARGLLGLTGTHLGCEHGVCGACTVLVDGRRCGRA